MRSTMRVGLIGLALAAFGPAVAPAATLCSGIGEEERAEAERGDFNLRVVYAEAGGAFIGGIATRVLQGGEVVAEGQCPGPWFLTKLPAGRYRVEGTFEGSTKTRDVTLGSSRQREVTIVF